MNTKSHLIEPHGSHLVYRVRSASEFQNMDQMHSLEVSFKTLIDAEQIAIGTFSPLEGFMRKKDIEAVLNDYRLANGVAWTLPVYLQLEGSIASKLTLDQQVILRRKDDSTPYAILTITDLFTFDLDEMALKMFGTNEMAHPGVASLKQGGCHFVGGKVDLLNRIPSSYKKYELTPQEARSLFDERGWKTIVGFHTRNVIHRAHECIQLLALENNHCDGLFVHPVVGPKKSGDYHSKVILDTYEIMVQQHYPKNKVVLGAFNTYSRYSGPREAVFTALCRKNFGCSHFIVGRDHTGVGNYYKPHQAHDLFMQLGDIGIQPVFFDSMHYCKKCDHYVTQCPHDENDVLQISGTQCRDMLIKGELPPDWFMRHSISEHVREELAKGNEVFHV